MCLFFGPLSTDGKKIVVKFTGIGKMLRSARATSGILFPSLGLSLLIPCPDFLTALPSLANVHAFYRLISHFLLFS